METMNTSEKARLFERLAIPTEITVNPFYDMLSERAVYDIRTGLKKYRRSAPKHFYNAQWLIKDRSFCGISNAEMVETLKNSRNTHGVSAIVYLDGVCVWG